MNEAFEAYRAKMFGAYTAYPVDAYTNFCVGWKAAVEASAKAAIDNGDRLEIHSSRIAESIRALAQ